MTPFQKLTGRSPASAQTAATPPVRVFRPDPTGNPIIDQAFRQIIDNTSALRNNYGPVSLFAIGTGDPVDVPPTDGDGNGFSTQLTLTREGIWVVTAAVSLDIESDNDVLFRVALQVDSKTITSHYGYAQLSGNGSVMMHQSWQVPGEIGNVCKLVIRKDVAATGTSTVDPITSTITAQYAGV